MWQKCSPRILVFNSIYFCRYSKTFSENCLKPESVCSSEAIDHAYALYTAWA